MSLNDLFSTQDADLSYDNLIILRFLVQARTLNDKRQNIEGV